MCGVFSVFLTKPLDDADIARFRAASAKLAHRGPDGTGEWIDRAQGVFISHHRLAIIALGETGRQPMVQGSHVLSFNGEIYNFRELAADYESGAGHGGLQSDTEVLLTGLARDGHAFLDRVDGMYAFVHWTGDCGYVATDPFNEKPLYVLSQEWGVCIASELSALRALGPPNAPPSEDATLDYLAFGQVLAPAVMVGPTYAKLPAAAIWTIRGGTVVDRRHHWTPTAPIPRTGAIERPTLAQRRAVRDALCESLERRLRADVDLAIFLSAGVDSSLIAALCARELGHRLVCYSVATDEGPDETDAAEATANHLGLPFQRLKYSDASNRDVEAEAALQLSLFGQLNANTGVLPLYRICRAVTEASVKCAMTGLGGDEISYGYSKNAFYWSYHHWFAATREMRRAVHTSALFSLAQRILPPATRFLAADHSVYLQNKLYPAFSVLTALPGFSQWLANRGEWFDSRRPGGLAVSVARYERHELLPDQQLVSADHASMRVGLELRTPFLSRALSDALSAIDERCLIAFGAKWVLREILTDYLPESLTNRRKQGFSVPLVSPDTADGCAPDALGLPAEWRDAVWRKRHEGGGWTMLAYRLWLAERAARLPPDGERATQ